MSRGVPDISDTVSLLVLNITFRTGAEELYPHFNKYGKVRSPRMLRRGAVFLQGHLIGGPDQSG